MRFLWIPLVCAFCTFIQRVVLDRIRQQSDLGTVSIRLPLMCGPSPACCFAPPPQGPSRQEQKAFVGKVPEWPKMEETFKPIQSIPPRLLP